METPILLLTTNILDFKEKLKEADKKVKNCSANNLEFHIKVRGNIQNWINECQEAIQILQEHSKNK